MDTGVVGYAVRQAVQFSERGLRHQDFPLAIVREMQIEKREGSTVFPDWLYISQSFDKRKALGHKNNYTDTATAKPKILIYISFLFLL